MLDQLLVARINELEAELEKTKRVVDDLISAMCVMPCSWEEFVGEDLAERAMEVSIEWRNG